MERRRDPARLADARGHQTRRCGARRDLWHDHQMTPTRPTRILILGGGFGGVYTALTLEKLLKREIAAGAVELGLVSRENYMVFQPMLPEVISGSIGLTKIAPIRLLCPKRISTRGRSRRSNLHIAPSPHGELRAAATSDGTGSTCTRPGQRDVVAGETAGRVPAALSTSAMRSRGATGYHTLEAATTSGSGVRRALRSRGRCGASPASRPWRLTLARGSEEFRTFGTRSSASCAPRRPPSCGAPTRSRFARSASSLERCRDRLNTRLAGATIDRRSSPAARGMPRGRS